MIKLKHSLHYIFHLIIFSIILIGCVKDPLFNNDLIPTTDFNNGVLVVNEGPIASLTYYNPNDNVVIQNYFTYKNSFLKLGDLANDICIVNDKCIVPVAGSGVLQVISLPDGLTKGLITFPKNSFPNRILKKNDSIVFVTCNNGDLLVEVNLNKYEITKIVNTPPAPEAMAIVYNKLIVLNSGYGNLRQKEVNASTFSIYNLNDLSLIKNVPTSINPTQLIFLKSNGKFYIQSVSIDNSSSEFIEYNGLTFDKERTWFFKQSLSLRHPFCIDSVNQKAYILGIDGVLAINLFSQNSQISNFVNNIKNTTAIDISPNGEIYVAQIDALASGLGKIYRYNNSGELVYQFNAGIYPGAFGFY
jgi:hypothetical protein